MWRAFKDKCVLYLCFVFPEKKIILFKDLSQDKDYYDLLSENKTIWMAAPTETKMAHQKGNQNAGSPRLTSICLVIIRNYNHPKYLVQY